MTLLLYHWQLLCLLPMPSLFTARTATNNAMRKKTNGKSIEQLTNAQLAKRLRSYWLLSARLSLPVELAELLISAAERLQTTIKPQNEFDEMGLS